MRNFSGNKRTDRKKDFGKKDRRSFGRDSVKSFERSSMHRATCDSCGKDCEVPFKPTSGKPIYCSSCFDKNQSKDQKKYGHERSERRFSSSDSRKRNNDGEDGNSINQLKKEIAQLNRKVDEILEILNSALYAENYEDDYEEEIETLSPEKKKRSKGRTKKD